MDSAFASVFWKVTAFSCWSLFAPPAHPPGDGELFTHSLNDVSAWRPPWEAAPARGLRSESKRHFSFPQAQSRAKGLLPPNSAARTGIEGRICSTWARPADLKEAWKDTDGCWVRSPSVCLCGLSFGRGEREGDHCRLLDKASALVSAASWGRERS